MNGSANFLVAERGNHPLDLAPMAECDDIAGIAAFLGAGGCLERRIVAESVDQPRRVGKRRAAMDERIVHARAISRSRFPD